MYAAACPYSTPKFNREDTTEYFDAPVPATVPLKAHQQRPTGKAKRCTLCIYKTSEGLAPKCVEACAIKALTFVDYDNSTDEQKAMLAKFVALNEKAGTKPKLRYIASHCDIAGSQEKM